MLSVLWRWWCPLVGPGLTAVFFGATLGSSDQVLAQTFSGPAAQRTGSVATAKPQSTAPRPVSQSATRASTGQRTTGAASGSTSQPSSILEPSAKDASAQATGVHPASCTSCAGGNHLPAGRMNTYRHVAEPARYHDDCCSSDDCQGGCGATCLSGPGLLQSILCRTNVRAELPIYWRKGHSTPPLVTTSPVGTAANIAGQLGQDSTEILQGGVFGQDAYAGFRITTDTWLDRCQNFGVLFRYWNAGTRNDRDDYDSSRFPILARPFFNTSVPNAFANDTQLVAYPGTSVGSLSIDARSQLYGLDVSLRRNLYRDCFTRFDWLYGYQHVFLGEHLAISSDTTVVGDVPPLQGSTIAVLDRFETENRLHGSTSGFIWTRQFACFRWENMLRLNFGSLSRQAQVRGETTTTSGGTSSTTAEGLLARETNSRSVIDSTFVIAPEVGVNLAYALGPHLDFTIGYNYLMVPKVWQAGRLIDRDLRVNLSDPPTGPLDPQLVMNEGRYWVRTLGLGLQLRY